MQWDAGGIKGAWTLQIASFDEKRIVFAVAVRVLPVTDGVPAEGRLDLALLGPRAPIGIDATRIMDVLDEHVYGLRGDDDFHRLIDARLPGHAGGRQVRVGEPPVEWSRLLASHTA